MSTPLVYFILGPAASGRRAVLADLIAGGLDAEAHPFLLASTNELPAPPEVRERLAAVPNLIEDHWNSRDGGRFAAELPDNATHIFVLADGRGNPVDQIEAFHSWLPASGAQLARVITIVNCRIGSEHAELMRWYDACVHFSDAVLLNRREGVPNKWVTDFTARFRKAHFPCLIELVKDDRVANPALILAPEARRISMLFDPAEEWPLPVDDIEESAGEDDESAEDLIGGTDPYLERLASGRRAKEIPDINRYLPAV